MADGEAWVRRWAEGLPVPAADIRDLMVVCFPWGLEDGETGAGMVLGSLSPLTDILHALVVPIGFAPAASVAIFTSEHWKRGPTFIEDSWRPPLRKPAFYVPAIVILRGLSISSGSQCGITAVQVFLGFTTL